MSSKRVSGFDLTVWKISLAVAAIFFPLVFSDADVNNHLETPIREALLKPRNFNPHPYQHGSPVKRRESYRALAGQYERDLTENSISSIQLHPTIKELYNTAPLQFPSNPTRIRTLNNRSVPNLPIPYATLKNHIKSNNHNLVDDSDNDIVPNKQYAFSYTVRDIHSGDDFSHTQQLKNGAVKGMYKVQLPDGRVQIVRYTADDNGYNAKVSYLGNAIKTTKESLPSTQLYNSYRELANNNRETDWAQLITPTRPTLVKRPHKIKHKHATAFATPSSSIFVSTVKPPEYKDIIVQLQPAHADLHAANIVHGNTYVISPKLTNIGRSYECYNCEGHSDTKNTANEYAADNLSNTNIYAVYYHQEHDQQ